MSEKLSLEYLAWKALEGEGLAYALTEYVSPDNVDWAGDEQLEEDWREAAVLLRKIESKLEVYL